MAPHVNGIYFYKGKPVMITGGQYYGSYGRISNHWTFRFIKKDGTLGRQGSDYDNEMGKFVPADAVIKTKVEIQYAEEIYELAYREYKTNKNHGKRAMHVCKHCKERFVRQLNESVTMFYIRLRTHVLQMHPAKFATQSPIAQFSFRKITKPLQKKFPIRTNDGDLIDI